MDLFFQSVVTQTQNRTQGTIPDMESYISVRRDNSGCKPCFQLAEFAAGIDLPDEVIKHPSIQALEEASNDLVTWSNVSPSANAPGPQDAFVNRCSTIPQDLFSFNVEQSRHDNFNMVAVVMQEKGYSLQEAVDFVGDLCKKTIERFDLEKKNLPSWGPDRDREVAMYVDGLQNWIVGGFLHPRLRALVSSSLTWLRSFS